MSSYTFDMSLGRDRLTSREQMITLKEARRTIEKMMIIKKPKQERTPEEKVKIVPNKNRKLILCVETGETFPSVAQAAESMGLDKDKIFACLRCKANEVQGYRFEYKAKQTVKRPVVCVETGVKYESITSAGKIHGVTDDSIRIAIARGWKSCGFHWKYL